MTPDEARATVRAAMEAHPEWPTAQMVIELAAYTKATEAWLVKRGARPSPMTQALIDQADAWIAAAQERITDDCIALAIPRPPHDPQDESTSR